MERRLQNPLSAELAYRWFWATYVETINWCRDRLNDETENRRSYQWRYKPNQLNEEIFACYNLTEFEDHVGDPGGRKIRVDFIIHLFQNARVTCAIEIWDAREPTEEPNVEDIRAQINTFCARAFLLCRCDSLAIARLDNRCMDCFLYHYQRTDNDCCPVCLEDEGRWVQLSCSHVIHTYCWARTSGRKCPVCRAVNDNEEMRHNYPFELRTAVKHSVIDLR